jgi:exosortase family protein XrtM
MNKPVFLRRLAAFVLVFAALQCAWQWCAQTPRAERAIELAIVAPAAWLANMLTPQVRASAAGRHLRAPGGGINVVNGCDGTETLFLLLAGFAVAPLGRRSRLLGALLGVPLVYALNQARILALFYAHRRDSELFDLLHGYLTPILMVLVIAVYFHGWLLRSETAAAASAP